MTLRPLFHCFDLALILVASECGNCSLARECLLFKVSGVIECTLNQIENQSNRSGKSPRTKQIHVAGDKHGETCASES